MTARNLKQRQQVHERCMALKEERDRAEAAADLIEDDAAWQAESKRIFDHYQPMIDGLTALESALAYPEARNAWFQSFAASFPEGCTRISRKQAEVFFKYTEEEHNYSGKIRQRKCRCGGKLYTLTGQYIKVEVLASL